jgi:hypothetical protein
VTGTSLNLLDQCITEILLIYRVILNYCRGPSLKPAQSTLYTHGGEGGYEQTSKQSFVLYLSAKPRLIDFCGLRENASGIRSTASGEVLGLPAPFRSRTRQVS